MSEEPNATGRSCVVLGAGGHACVVIDAIRASGAATVAAVLDADRGRWGSEVLDAPVLGGDDLVGSMVARGVSWFTVGVGSTGDSRVRERLYELGRRAGLMPLLVRHPSALCSPWAVLGDGCQLLAGAIVNAGARIGVNVIVNTGAIVEHDCVIADHVHIATGARLASGVTVGRGAHVGAGAAVRQGIAIGERAIVGVAAGVVCDVPPGAVVGGVPAKALRPS